VSTKAPRHWCRRLRWKSYALDARDPAQVAEVFASGSASYCCLTTASAMGEDGQLAAPERCTSSRVCYRAHPLLPVLDVA